MKRDEKINAAMDRARSIRRDVKRFGETEIKMPALVLLCYRIICLEEKIASCKTCSTKENRP